MNSTEFILLGKRISELRTARRFSQERLSEMCGISSRHISELERGKSNPSYQVLKQVAEALSVSLEALLDFEHLKTEKELEAEMIAMIKTLPPDKLKMAYRLLTVVKE